MSKKKLLEQKKQLLFEKMNRFKSLEPTTFVLNPEWAELSKEILTIKTEIKQLEKEIEKGE